MFDVNIDGMTPQKLINPKALCAVIRDFFGRSPALAVHGSDESAGRADAQAPSLGPRAGRSEPRSRRLRSPRRASVALRPHLPDRDAGRSEHRSHQLDEHLCAHQRVRLHRNALPQGRERPRHRRRSITSPPIGRRTSSSPRRMRRSTTRAISPARQVSRAVTAATSSKSSRRRSTTWTSRRSSSSPWLPA